MGINHVFATLCGVVALFGDRATAAELFSDDGPITPVSGKVLKTIAVGDNMHYEFDLELHSVPTTGSGFVNVFGVFPSDAARMPSLWIHDTADDSGGQYEGFMLKFEDDTDVSLGGEPVVAGQSYHFEMDWTQSSIFVKINGETVWDASTSTHTNYDAADIYMSHSDWAVPDVTVTNFVISTDISCYVTGYECESYEVCGDDGECGRDCNAFRIDDYLLDCSAEFAGNENDISSMQSDISALQVSVADIPALKSSVVAIELHLQKLSEYSSAHTVSGIADGAAALNTESMEWTLTGKDVVIVALLSVNVVITVIMFIVCKTGSGGKVVFGD